MNKINIFLAFFIELKADREQSQDERNKKITESDLLVSLASSKLEMHTAEEFDQSLRYVRINQETFYFT